MEDTRSARHRATIVEQFTAQAAGYAQAEPIRNEQALGLLLDACAPSDADRVLDVACGTGVVTCALAGLAAEVTGIDVTPAMIEHARELALERGLTNLVWRVAAIPPLPFEDGSFDLVVSRYAFHHFVDPPPVLREMARVCRPGGRIVVCDLAPDPRKADAFNAVERLRDASHAGALPVTSLIGLFAQTGLGGRLAGSYRLAGELESLLERSASAAGAADEVRRRFVASLGDDSLGVEAWREGERIHYSFPIAIVVGERATVH